MADDADRSEERAQQEAVAQLLREALRPRSNIEFGEALFRSKPLETKNSGWGWPGFDIPALQEAKDRKIQALKERLNSELFRSRLMEQGVPFTPEHERVMKDYIKDVPVKLTPGQWGNFRGKTLVTLAGETQEREGRPSVELFPHNIHGRGRSKTERRAAADKRLQQVLSHELEHVFSNSYNYGWMIDDLSDAQEETLRKIAGREIGQRVVSTESLEHVRVAIMLTREALGKEILTEDDVQKLISGEHQNKELQKLQKVLKEGLEERPIEELTRLLNLVAEQQADDGTRVA